MELQGIDIGTSLEEVAKNLATKPGVYMFCAGENILYVGKARNLRKRVASYLKPKRLDNKSLRLMERATRLQWVITASNTEALLLEYNFIKKHKPPYNIILRDDKSYPYIYVSAHKDYPLLTMHRGTKKNKGDYYGPYPNAMAVHRSISQLQKIFKVRSCSDSFFANRTRPCLQHQIGRCTAPCVDAISREDYMKNIDYVKDFLSGKDSKVINDLTAEMQKASDEFLFEYAAELRDKVQAMRNLQENQYISRGLGNIDVLGVYSHGNVACVYLMLVRNGKVLDSRHFFFRSPAFDTEQNLLAAFIEQYYLTPDSKIPEEIISSYAIAEGTLDGLTEHYGKNIKIKHKVRGTRKRWLDMAQESCKSLLISHVNNKNIIREELDNVSTALGIGERLERIECFDISHSGGKEAQASCVVFTEEGAVKKEYRRFNIGGIVPGDDYAAMKQAVARRYATFGAKYDNIDSVRKENTSRAPQLIVIDGGKGQLNAAISALQELNLTGAMKNIMESALLVGISKDDNRTFGKEKLHISSWSSPNNQSQGVSENENENENKGALMNTHDIRVIEISSLNRYNPLELLLRVRDEAHRFALAGHRRKRNKAAMATGLDAIKGLGEVRKRALIKYFGGIAPVKNASIEDLAKVPGFGKSIAANVFEQLQK